MQIATISSGKQVTLNNSLLAHLGLQPKGKVWLEETDEGILIKPMKKTIVEQTAGSLRKYVKDKSKLGKSWGEIKKVSDQEYTRYLADQDRKTYA